MHLDFPSFSQWTGAKLLSCCPDRPRHSPWASSYCLTGEDVFSLTLGLFQSHKAPLCYGCDLIKRIGDGMAQITSVSGLAAPATVAQIELSDPVTVTHISVADFGPDSNSRPDGEFWPDGEYSIAPALVLVRLHGQPIGTVLVDAPGGKVDE